MGALDSNVAIMFGQPALDLLWLEFPITDAGRLPGDSPFVELTYT
jgi:hypothetical protein